MNNNNELNSLAAKIALYYSEAEEKRRRSEEESKAVSEKYASAYMEAVCEVAKHCATYGTQFGFTFELPLPYKLAEILEEYDLATLYFTITETVLSITFKGKTGFNGFTLKGLNRDQLDLNYVNQILSQHKIVVGEGSSKGTTIIEYYRYGFDTVKDEDKPFAKLRKISYKTRSKF